jgi:hypothetical protein
MSQELPIPLQGINKGSRSSNMNNVRPRDVLEKRIRLGQRPGLARWGSGTQIGATEQPVVAIAVVHSVV